MLDDDDDDEARWERGADDEARNGIGTSEHEYEYNVYLTIGRTIRRSGDESICKIR